VSDALHKAVNALIEPSKVRLYREDTKRGSWHEIPSLWSQLTASGQWAGSNTGGGAFGSRPVISTGIVALIIEITDAITEAATDFGRIIRVNDQRDYPAELRAIAANADPDTAVWWTEHVRKWVSQARSQLGLNPQRPQWARDTCCPNCGADSAQTQDDERTIRTPALAITWGYPEGEPEDYHEDHEYKVRAVECRACSACWFRGPELDSLVEAMFNQRTAKTA
jgi:hypothetical protein